MRRLFVSALVIFLLLSLKAIETYPFGSRYAAMANASVAMQGFWSAGHNQAGLATLRYPMAGFYHESRFMMKELSVDAFALVIPTSTGVFSINTEYFGYSKYFESISGFSYSRAFNDKFLASVQLDYLLTHIAEGYENEQAVTFELGFIAIPTDKLSVGAHVFNPLQMGESAIGEKIPFIGNVGLSYKIDDSFLICIESEKKTDYKNLLKLGAEYGISDKLFLRAGVSGKPLFTTFGMGYYTQKLHFDIAFSRHLAGTTPHLSVAYVF